MMKTLRTLASALLLAANAAAAPSSPALAPALAAWRRRDFKTVIALSRPLADKGVPDAQLLLGLAYFLGPEGGLPRSDYNAAAKWFLEARSRRQPEAAYAYALLLTMAGEQVSKDDRTQAYAIAARLGSPGGQEGMGLVFLTGNEGAFTPDITRADHYLKLAAKGGDASVYRDLSLFYEKGKLSPSPEYIEAYKWQWAAAHAPIVDAIQEPLTPSLWWGKKQEAKARLRLSALEAKLNTEQIAEGRRLGEAVLAR